MGVYFISCELPKTSVEEDNIESREGFFLLPCTLCIPLTGVGVYPDLYPWGVGGIRKTRYNIGTRHHQIQKRVTKLFVTLCFYLAEGQGFEPWLTGPEPNNIWLTIHTLWCLSCCFYNEYV